MIIALQSDVDSLRQKTPSNGLTSIESDQQIDNIAGARFRSAKQILAREKVEQKVV
jgi:hypothetical protein